MQDTVRYQLQHFNSLPSDKRLKPGDVLLANHPDSGLTAAGPVAASRLFHVLLQGLPVFLPDFD